MLEVGQLHFHQCTENIIQLSFLRSYDFIVNPSDAADASVNVDTDDEADGTAAIIDAGESPGCPDCGAMELNYSEGCKTREACGWSESS